MSRTGSGRGARRKTNRGMRGKRIAVVFTRVTRKEGDRRICWKRKKGTIKRRLRRRKGNSGGRHG